MDRLTLILFALAALLVVLVVIYRAFLKPRMSAPQIAAVREAAGVAFAVMEGIALSTPGKLDEILLTTVRSALGFDREAPLVGLTSEQKRIGALAVVKTVLGRSLRHDEYPAARAEFAAKAAEHKGSMSLADRGHRADLSMQIAGPTDKQ